jgi:hypothetical protein
MCTRLSPADKRGGTGLGARRDASSMSFPSSQEGAFNQRYVELDIPIMETCFSLALLFSVWRLDDGYSFKSSGRKTSIMNYTMYC